MTPSPKTPEELSPDEKLAREVGERVKQARGKMTQTQLAKATKLAQSVISKIEDGKKKRVEAKQLQLIADATGTSVPWLLGRAPGVVAPPTAAEVASDSRRRVVADDTSLDDYLARHPDLPEPVKWLLRENRHFRNFPWQGDTERVWDRLARIAAELLAESGGPGGAPGGSSKRKG